MTQVAALLALDGRIAVVTGGGTGIGLATASLLADAGARVVVLEVDPAHVQTLRSAGRFAVHELDVADEPAVVRAIADIAAAHGRIDILVNNAGFGARVPSVELTLPTWQRVLDVTLTASFLCAREAGRHMLVRRSGSVINIASIMGVVGNPIFPNLAYHAAKGGMVNLTRALAAEWGSQGVRVNAVAPTFVETDLTRAMLSDAERRAAILAQTPMGRLATVDEIAQAVLFLASDMAAMITGQILAVDGGWLSR